MWPKPESHAAWSMAPAPLALPLLLCVAYSCLVSVQQRHWPERRPETRRACVRVCIFDSSPMAPPATASSAHSYCRSMSGPASSAFTPAWAACCSPHSVALFRDDDQRPSGLAAISGLISDRQAVTAESWGPGKVCIRVVPLFPSEHSAHKAFHLVGGRSGAANHTRPDKHTHLFPKIYILKDDMCA